MAAGVSAEEEGGEGGAEANDGDADGDDAVRAEHADGREDGRDGAGRGRRIRVDVERKRKMMKMMNGLSHLSNVCLKECVYVFFLGGEAVVK